MKKLINDPRDVMRESLAGFAAAHSDILKVSFDPVYVVRADAPVTGKVGIISGGGSGHEPLHGGFVGQGMLDAACPGQVFTSPSPDQMEAATAAVDGGAGVLHIVKNYTGDVMNFEMAAELCQARGIQVEAVVINDDVAVQDSLYTAGRRGVGDDRAGGKDLRRGGRPRLRSRPRGGAGPQGERHGRSMGMALTPCTVPAAGKPNFELGDGEIEMGVGIHGEPGRERMPLRPAKELVAHMAEAILADLPFRGGDRVIAMVSGMGGTPLIELYLVYRELELILRARQITASPPPGRQLHHQPRHGRLLDHPVAGRRRVAVPVGRPGADAGPALGDLNMAVSKQDVLRWLDALQKVFAENRQQLTDLDSAVGDGDFGISLDRGFTAVQAELSANPPADLRSVFQNVATVLIRTMGGTSGPLLGTFFLRAGAACAGKSELAPADVVALFQAGVEGLQQRGKAELGDKTMLDALASRSGCHARCPGGWKRPGGNPGTGRGGGRSRHAGDHFHAGAQGPCAAIWENAASDTRTPARPRAHLLLKAAADVWRS